MHIGTYSRLGESKRLGVRIVHYRRAGLMQIDRRERLSRGCGLETAEIINTLPLLFGLLLGPSAQH